MKREAQAIWTQGLQFVGKSGSNHAVVMDGPERVGGNDTGIRPMEMFMVAMCGCTGMDVVSVLKKMRIDFVHLEVQAHGEFDDEHPRPMKSVHLKYLVYGDDVDREKVEKAIDMSQTRYCSILATISGAVEWSSSLDILPSAAARGKSSDES